MFEHIVVALNDSKCAQRALDLAFSLAKTENARITICCVVDPKVVTWGSNAMPSAEAALGEAGKRAARLTTEAVARASALDIAVDANVRFGEAAGEIVACAAENGADGIVMGTHGWSGLKHIVVGSVAEGVLRVARCPVIVVRDSAELPAMDVAATTP